MKLLLCKLGLHDWEETPTGWGEYTIKCKQCSETHHHLERGDWQP
ncbi:MAG: hypothetical protein ABIJ47_01355 [Candidatus Bathyarchaeota archaeon]